MNTAKKTSLSKRPVLFLFLLAIASPTFADSYAMMQAVNYTAILIETIAIGLGVSLFLGALFKFKRYGEMRTFMSQQMTIGKPLSMMFAGICLLCLPIVTKTLSLALWGYSNPLAYPIMASSEATQMMKPIIAAVRVVGLIGIMRGFMLLSRAGGESAQPGSIGKSVLHMVGGLLCLHVENVYSILKSLLTFTI